MNKLNKDEIPQCGHFLTRRQQELLQQYAKLPKRTEETYDELMDELMYLNSFAFHNKATLNTRKFFHCPNNNIPYKICFRK